MFQLKRCRTACPKDGDIYVNSAKGIVDRYVVNNILGVPKRCWSPQVDRNSCTRWRCCNSVRVQERADRDKWCPLVETESRTGGSMYAVSLHHSHRCRFPRIWFDANTSPTPIMGIVARNIDDGNAGYNPHPFLFREALRSGFVRTGSCGRYRPVLAHITWCYNGHFYPPCG